MQIAQLLIAPAGQTDRELQIPDTDLGEVAVPLATPFDLVFMDQKSPLGIQVDLPTTVAVETSADPASDVRVSEGQMDPEHVFLLELGEVSPRTFQLADGGPEELPEVATSVQPMIGSSVLEDVKVAEPTRSPDLVMSDTGGVRSDPDPGQLVGGKETLPARQARPLQSPDVVGEAPPKPAGTEMPGAIVEVAKEVPASEPVSPVGQEIKAEGAQYAPAAERPRFVLPFGQVEGPEAQSVRTPVLSVPSSQKARAPDTVVAAVVAQVPNNGPAVEKSGQAVQRPAETGQSSQDKAAVPSRLDKPKYAGTDGFIPVDTEFQQQSSPTSQVEKLVPAPSASNAVPEFGAKTEYIPDTKGRTTLPLTAAPLVYAVEHEAAPSIPDDIGFRVVEQVLPPSGDLKPVAIARGAELPRMAVAQIAEIARQQPDRPVELTLSPEELGRLRMTFQSEGSAMHVVLSFERPDTLDLMRRHIDQLAQEMRGFGMSEVNFTFQQQTSDGGGGAFPNDESARSSDEHHSAPRSESDDVVPLVLNVSGHAGVDIRV